MSVETMTGWERIWTTLNGGKPDRVPVVPTLSAYPATFQGMTQGEYYSNIPRAIEAMCKTWDDVGGWDALWLPLPYDRRLWNLRSRYPVRVVEPGVDVADDFVIQTFEGEFINYEDYETIAEIGWAKYFDEVLIYRISDWTPEELPKVREELMADLQYAMKLWAERKAEPRTSYGGAIPFFHLSLGRSLIRFTEDLYFRPEKLHKALRRMTDDMTQNCIDAVKITGRKNVLFAEERSSAYHYPLHIFEEFWMKYVKEMVDALYSEGIISTFHLDTDFSKNIPSFKKNLPKQSFCLELDSTTDIFAARDYMGDYCAFHGDIPATLMAFGEPEEVEAYCKKLIKEVGRNGQFTLGNGCECPIDTKRENFITMLETAKKSFY